MHRLLRLAPMLLALTSVCSRAAEPSLAKYARVDVAETKTSIYIGSVTMTLPTFVRESGQYVTSYHARVFPYFFYNESGRLSISVSDDALRQLAHGEPIQFQGEGVSDDGSHRHVEGRAVPADAHGGKIKVRVFVSKKIQLIFNTTYRFVE